MDRWPATAAAGAPSYWCYSCERFVRTAGDAGLVCPGCDSGFLEQMDAPPPRRAVAPSAFLRRRGAEAPHGATEVRPRRAKRGVSGDRSGSPFNPVIVLRRSAAPPGDEAPGAVVVEELEAASGHENPLCLYEIRPCLHGFHPIC